MSDAQKAPAEPYVMSPGRKTDVEKIVRMAAIEARLMPGERVFVTLVVIQSDGQSDMFFAEASSHD